MVCPFGIDLLEGTAAPIDCGAALVITVRPGSLAIEAAEDVVYQLCHVLLSFDLGHMGVEICEAEAIYLNSTSQLSTPGVGMTFEQVYSTPTLGTSIGPAGNGGSTGSLGFYLKVEHHGKKEVLAVTCHHVVAPGIETAVDAEKTPIQVESPSTLDHNAWTVKLAQMSSSSPEAHSFFANLGYNAPSRCGDSRLQTARAFSRQMGTVRTTSGMIEKSWHHDCHLDWALFELEASRFPAGLGQLSNKPPAPLLEHLFAHGYDPQEAVRNSIVFKMGRTTGSTMGVSHGCRPVVQVYMSSRQPVRSIEDAFLPFPGVERFAKKGDSGALVYDAQGAGRWMVWGGLIEQAPAEVDVERVVWATPVKAILGDIEAKLALRFGHSDFQVTLLP